MTVAHVTPLNKVIFGCLHF